MTKEQVEYYIDSIKKDIEVLVKNEYRKRTHDLIDSLLLQDLPKIIEWVENVNKVLDVKLPDGTGRMHEGASDMLESIKRQVYK